MKTALDLVAGPVSEPLTLAEVKTHLRIDGTEQDAEITAILTRARQTLEADTGRALLAQTWRQRMERWPCGDTIVLDRVPVQSLVGITYRRQDGVMVTVDPAHLVVEPEDAGFVQLREGYDWPTEPLDRGLPVRVEYTCGYGSAALVPPGLLAALLLRAESMYRFRGAVTMGNTSVESKPLALGYDRLIEKYRERKF